jgi:hypothetical protein
MPRDIVIRRGADITKAALPFGLFVASAFHTRARMQAAGASDRQLFHMVLAAIVFYGLGVWAGKAMY